MGHPRWTMMGYFVGREWKVLALPVALIALTIVGYRSLQSQSAGHWKPVPASIVRFGVVESRWRPGRIMVVAVTKDGVPGQDEVAQEQLRGCKVGDSIPAWQDGAMLRLNPSPCEPNVR